MKKNAFFYASIMLAMIMGVSVGCRDTDAKLEIIEDSFYVMMEFPYINKEFNEGYPKDIKATAYRGDNEVERNVTFLWSSDIDGDIAEGAELNTEYLSIGKHVITIIAYYKNDRTASDTAEITKVGRKNRRAVKKEVLAPRRVTDRIDGTVYVDNRDGTVSDTNTQRMWEQADDGYPKTVYEAYQYCQGLDLGGHTDWRMPTIGELKQIANISPYIEKPIICEVFDTKTNGYWSQTRSSFKLSKYPDMNFYHSVEFVHKLDLNQLYGQVAGAADEYSHHYVRCVR